MSFVLHDEDLAIFHVALNVRFNEGPRIVIDSGWFKVSIFNFLQLVSNILMFLFYENAKVPLVRVPSALVHPITSNILWSTGSKGMSIYFIIV